VTDWERLARPSLRGLERYDPGPSRDALKQQHGIAELAPLNWNEDLFGPPAHVLEAAAAELRNAQYYPERAYADFREELARQLGVPPGYLVPAHGAQSLIGTIASAFIDPGTRVVVPRLTYGLYVQVSAAAGATVTRTGGLELETDLDAVAAAARERRARLVWLCDPNNPTGSLITPDAWRAFLDRLPDDCVVVADEAYIDFAEPAARADRLHDVTDGRPVIVVRSFSKLYGLAGLRLGYAIAHPEAARLLDIVQEPFNVNRVALAAGRAALSRPAFVEERRAEVARARNVLRDELARAGIRSHPSQANFVLAELGVDDRAVCEDVLLHGVLVRGGHDFGMPGFARVTVAPEPQMRRAAAEIHAAVGRNGDGIR
jgi:histidinol-phosphate aminotransferase